MMAKHEHKSILVVLTVGAIGALLSFAVLQTAEFFLGISSLGGTIIEHSGIPLLYSYVSWAFCGAITGLLRPRHGIFEAAAIMAAVKFILSAFSGLFLDGIIVTGNLWIALTAAIWFGISISGIIWFYEWTVAKLPELVRKP